MITLLFYLLGTVIYLVATVLSKITFYIPAWISTAIQTEIYRLGVLQGVLPIVADSQLSGIASILGLLDIALWLISCIVFFFVIKLLKIILDLIPFRTKGDKIIND